MMIGMSTIATKLMTAEEFWVSPENGKRRELVAGEVVETIPAGGIHAAVTRRLIEQLGPWARSGDRGKVGPEAGFILARDPDVVRAPDVFFVSKSRFPPTGIPEAFWPIAPYLAVKSFPPRRQRKRFTTRFLSVSLLALLRFGSSIRGPKK
jgi:Uma2 family endonuclease